MILLFCTAPRNVYAFLSLEAYPNAFAPFLSKVPDVPNFIGCTNKNYCTTVRATHARDKKTMADIVMMNTALTNFFLKALLT